MDDATIASHLDGLCKPPRSLGELERLAFRLCQIQDTLTPCTRPRRLVVFAADHGVVRQGVSAWPAEVTSAVTGVMATGRTASGVMSRVSETQYRVVNVGCLQPPMVERSSRPATERYLDAPVRCGTRDLATEAAMSRDEFAAAWQVGAAQAEQAHADRVRVIAGGEMGIGNTTASACLACLLAGAPVAEAVGRGAGVDDDGLAAKQKVVKRVTDHIRPLADQGEWRQVAAAVGGLEIVALAGFYAAAARHRMTIVLDGYIASSAALLAEKIFPGTREQMIAAHQSREPGHRHLLAALQLHPFLRLDMALGEGTGAVTLMPLLDFAAAMVSDMATLADLSPPPAAAGASPQRDPDS